MKTCHFRKRKAEVNSSSFFNQYYFQNQKIINKKVLMIRVRVKTNLYLFSWSYNVENSMLNSNGPILVIILSYFAKNDNEKPFVIKFLKEMP